jgi:antitoxin component of MazEF toxin-antitoxin module
MDEKTIKAILAALSGGERVELLLQKDGSIVIQTVRRKKLKI